LSGFEPETILVELFAQEWHCY